MNNAQRAHAARADEDHGGPGHDHGHNHAGHSHASHSHAGHSHAPASFGRAFAIGATLNIGFVVIEAIYGIISQLVPRWDWLEGQTFAQRGKAARSLALVSAGQRTTLRLDIGAVLLTGGVDMG